MAQGELHIVCFSGVIICVQSSLYSKT